MYELKDKVVLITGAASGIGAAISTEVLEEGAKHIRLLDINENNGVELQNELNNKYGANKTKFVKCDVTNDEQLFRALEDVKQEEDYLDLVINNAGVANESSYAAIRKQTEINYLAVVNGTLKAIELMDKSKGGQGGTVINVASIAGLYPICPPIFNYCSTKAAVLQFTGCIGREPFYSDTGVRVMALCFGVTNTPIITVMSSFRPEDDSIVRDILGQYALQSPESAAKGAVEAYKKGKSTSAWVIQGGQALDISEEAEKCHDIMAKLLI